MNATAVYTTETGSVATAPGFTISCLHSNGETGHVFSSYEAAESFLWSEMGKVTPDSTGHLAVCGDDYCRAGRMFIIDLSVDPFEDYYSH